MRTWKAVIADRLVGDSAELGFCFALFPTLSCAGSIPGPAVRAADQIYLKILNYLALLDTFNETTAAVSGGKVTFGSIAAIWSASIRISAIRTRNAVYKQHETHSHFIARIHAVIILLTWFYVSGLMLLQGAEINSVVEEAAAESGHLAALRPHPDQNL